MLLVRSCGVTAKQRSACYCSCVCALCATHLLAVGQLLSCGCCLRLGMGFQSSQSTLTCYIKDLHASVGGIQGPLVVAPFLRQSLPLFTPLRPVWNAARLLAACYARLLCGSRSTYCLIPGTALCLLASPFEGRSSSCYGPLPLIPYMTIGA